MRTIEATVGAEITLRGLDPRTVSSLRRALRYPNPAYVKATMGGEDTDAVPPHLYACEERQDGTVIAPRGAIFDIGVVLRTQRIKARWTDERSSGEELPCPTELIGIELRDYQEEGAAAFRKFLQGLVILPCAGGKTMVGLASIARIRRSALVVVPTKDLVDQWSADVRLLLGVEPAIFGKGKRNLGPITIATKDALVYHRDTDLSRFGTTIFDECHRVPSATHQGLLRRIPARFRLGLTATPKRADGTTKLVSFSFGETLVEKTVPDLVEGGWLVLPSVQGVFTTFYYDFPETPDWSDYNALTDAIMTDRKRNDIIVDLVRRAPNETWMILSPSRKWHAKRLADRLRQAGLNALAVTGDTAAGKRRQAMQDLRDGELKIMCATSLADEGLNIKRLSRIVLALPESSKSKTTQRLGRCMRPLGEKQPIVYDIVDIEVDRLKKRWETRKSTYRKLGLEVQSCPTLSLFSTATA